MTEGQSTYKVLGVMSGTSLDGVDLALCYLNVSIDTVNHKPQWNYKIGVAETVSYAPEWKRRLQEGVHFSKGRLHTLNKEYTLLLGDIISEFIQNNSISGLDAVCSHGHTILHQPAKGVTLQIGNLPEIAQMVGMRTVCDFRVQDVALGGQGAPLVPIGDRLLFSEYDYCLNLGGFANCSFEGNDERIAYDICPVNIVMNSLAERFHRPYDNEGRIASSGKLHTGLLSKLNELPFYQNPAPKSLGLEWVQKNVWPVLNEYEISNEDLLHTFVEHIAIQLANQFEKGSSVLITGGGAYNKYLLQRVAFYKELTVAIPAPKLLEFKEALVFALLGVLRIREENNCLSSVTGAEKDHSGGFIYQP